MVVFQTGFRCFFLGAAGFSILAGLLWANSLSFGIAFSDSITPLAWHAHEMIFGYTLAVIFGFLLTAVKNWTGLDTLNGLPLLFVFVLWTVCRISFLINETIPVESIALLETLMFLLVLMRIGAPIIIKRQTNNYGIILLVLSLLACNLLFYSGILHYFPNGLNYGLYLGFYTILALVLVMSRRVIPFFIEKGVGYPVNMKNWQWLDIGSLILLAVYAFADVFYLQRELMFVVALGLFGLHAIRTWGWYTMGIWKKPLLWVLWLGYLCIVIGFFLKSLEYFFPISPFLSLHAFAVGGIGLITIGMMSRIALGHTGRNVIDSPAILFWVFIVSITAFGFRIFVPLFLPSMQSEFIIVSQIVWVFAFALFLFVYVPILIRPRVDGQPG